MRKYSAFIVLVIFISISCKQKKKEPEKKFISVISLIRSQVALIDTSLYPIMQIRYIDSLHNDTVFIPREQFETAAKDFLDIPDIADKKISRRFKEEAFFDNTLNKVVITYSPLDPLAEEIQKQELHIDPNAASDNNVDKIIINRVFTNRDSSVQKNMLWEMNKYFLVTTIRQLPGKPETTTTIRVSWNEQPYQ